jgi:hypothetical protein
MSVNAFVSTCTQHQKQNILIAGLGWVTTTLTDWCNFFFTFSDDWHNQTLLQFFTSWPKHHIYFIHLLAQPSHGGPSPQYIWSRGYLMKAEYISDGLTWNWNSHQLQLWVSNSVKRTLYRTSIVQVALGNLTWIKSTHNVTVRAQTIKTDRCFEQALFCSDERWTWVWTVSKHMKNDATNITTIGITDTAERAQRSTPALLVYNSYIGAPH